MSHKPNSTTTTASCNIVETFKKEIESIPKSLDIVNMDETPVTLHFIPLQPKELDM